MIHQVQAVQPCYLLQVPKRQPITERLKSEVNKYWCERVRSRRQAVVFKQTL